MGYSINMQLHFFLVWKNIHLYSSDLNTYD